MSPCPSENSQSAVICTSDNLTNELLEYLLESNGFNEVKVSLEATDVVQHCKTNPFPSIVILEHPARYSMYTKALRELHNLVVDPPLTILSNQINSAFAQEALRAGVRGIFSKFMTPASFSAAVRLVVAGEIFVPASYAQLNPRQYQSNSTFLNNGTDLTVKEKKVAIALCEGLSNKEIAYALHLSEASVKKYISNIVKKLDAKNRTHAALILRKVIPDER